MNTYRNEETEYTKTRQTPNEMANMDVVINGIEEQYTMHDKRYNWSKANNANGLCAEHWHLHDILYE